MRLSMRLTLSACSVLAFGCSTPDPLYCDEDTPCEDPELPFCDLEGAYPASDGISHTCIAEPAFAITLSDDDAQVRIAGELEIGVTLDRTGDFPGDVTVTAEDLPAGAASAPLTIPDGQTTGTLVIEAADSDPGAVAAARVVATAGPFESAADLRLLVLGPAGTLDPTFGTSGFAGEPAESSMDDAAFLGQLADGSVIVAGPITSTSDEAVLIRYSADGELDTSFGSDGVVQIAFDDAGIDVNTTMRFAQQSDGKLIVAAGSETGDIALARVTSDGELDPTFAGGGLAAIQIAGGIYIWVDAIGIGPEDEVIIAMARNVSRDQMSIVRFDRDGEKDLTFSGGRRDLDLGTGHNSSRVRPFADGSMLVAGAAYETEPPAVPFLVRLTATGALDTSFGDGGLLIGYSPALVEDEGSMLLLAVADGQATFRQLTPSGDLDSNFGDDGQLVVSVPAGWIAPRALLPGPFGLLTVGRPGITLSRFDLSTGGLDSTFGQDGIAAVALEDVSAQRAVRQADGRVVVLADNDSYPFLLARFFE